MIGRHRWWWWQFICNFQVNSSSMLLFFFFFWSSLDAFSWFLHVYIDPRSVNSTHNYVYIAFDRIGLMDARCFFHSHLVNLNAIYLLLFWNRNKKQWILCWLFDGVHAISHFHREEEWTSAQAEIINLKLTINVIVIFWSSSMNAIVLRVSSFCSHTHTQLIGVQAISALIDQN